MTAPNLKNLITEKYMRFLEDFKRPHFLAQLIQQGKAKGIEDAKNILTGQIFEIKAMLSLLNKSKVVVFSGHFLVEMAEARNYSLNRLEDNYLPFSQTFFQLDPAIILQTDEDSE